MNNKYRFIWIIVLVFYSAGCAGYVPGTLPSYDIPPPGTEPPIQVLTINSRVIITLTSGEEVKGTILDVTPDQILLNQKSYSGIKKVVYFKVDIQNILVKEINPTSTEAVVATGLAVVAGVLIAGAVALLIMCSGGCGFGN